MTAETTPVIRCDQLMGTVLAGELYEIEVDIDNRADLGVPVGLHDGDAFGS